GARVVPLRYAPDAPVRDEGGALYPLEIAENGFGDRVGSDQVFHLPLSAGEALRFRGRAAGARFAFPTYAVDEGDLVLDLAVVTYAQGPTVEVHVDGQAVGDAIDTRAQAAAVAVRPIPVRLTRGRHW